MRTELGNRAQRLVRYGYVPFMLLGFNGASYAIVTRGHSYLWLFPLLLLAFATAFAAERVLPSFAEWNERHGDEAANVWHAIVYETSNVAGVLLIPLVGWLFSLKPGSLLNLWPIGWPVWGQLLLALVAADAAFTFIHYMSHRWAPLWRLHAVHHGVGRLYGFNGVIRHPLHQSIDMIMGQAPLVIMGMTQDVALVLGFLITVTLIVQHSNVDQQLGPFSNLLSIGPIHHLHHVNWGKEGDCNFGLFLTLWDRLLGTFVPAPPRPIAAHDMGLDEVPDFPKRYGEQLLFPLRYQPGQGYERKAQ